MRCDALVGVRPGSRPSQVSIAGAVRCRKPGTVQYPTGAVCRGHHNSGFVSWSQTVGAGESGDQVRERAKAVLEGT